MKKKIFTAAAISAMVLFVAAGCGKTPSLPSQNPSTIIINPPSESTVANPASETESSVQTSETVSETETGSATDPVLPEGGNVSEEIPDFSGVWAEEIAGRGNIEFTKTADNKYTVSIHWSASAFEYASWTMDAEYFKGSKLLEYMNCEYKIVTFTDETTSTETSVYTGGTGYFWLEDGKLGWKSDNSKQDGIDGSSFFIKD